MNLGVELQLMVTLQSNTGNTPLQFLFWTVIAFTEPSQIWRETESNTLNVIAIFSAIYEVFWESYSSFVDVFSTEHTHQVFVGQSKVGENFSFGSFIQSL